MRRHAMMIAVLAVTLSGCGQEPTPTAPPPSAKSQSVAISAPTFDLGVEHPPTSGCLEVVVKGTPPQAGFRWQVNGQPVADETGGRLCREAIQRGDEVTVQALVGGQTLSRSLRVPNAPPRVTEVNFTVDPVKVIAIADSEDVDGDSVDLRYQWFVNGEPGDFLTDAYVPRGELQATDRLQVRITPADGIENGPTYASRQFALPNLPPRIVSTPPAKFEALAYSYQAKAKDPDNDRLTFSLENPPQGMLINQATGRITWPLTGVQPGTYQVKIVVRDPEGNEDRQEFVLTLGVPEGG